MFFQTVFSVFVIVCSVDLWLLAVVVCLLIIKPQCIDQGSHFQH